MLKIRLGDICESDCEAVVNAANSELRQGGGVCGAIFKAAGAADMRKACLEKAPVAAGKAAITSGFNLKADYVIHAVGPIYQDGKSGEAEALASAYRSSLELAVANACKSIAFPLISAGIYGYPAKEAMRIAFATIKAFIAENKLENGDEILVEMNFFDQSLYDMAKEFL